MKYKKKPVLVSAIRINAKDLMLREWPSWLNDAVLDGRIRFSRFDDFLGPHVEADIKTLEGNVEHAKEGDYIVQGVIGEIYPCDAKVFESAYDPYPEGE